jgi:hypothetical protein
MSDEEPQHDCRSEYRPARFENSTTASLSGFTVCLDDARQEQLRAQGRFGGREALAHVASNHRFLLHFIAGLRAPMSAARSSEEWIGWRQFAQAPARLPAQQHSSREPGYFTSTLNSTLSGCS